MKQRSNQQQSIISIGMFVVALALLSATHSFAAEYVSVVKDDVNLRSGPTTQSQVLYKLPAGYPLKVLARKGKWLKVIDFENEKGWIYSTLVNSTPHVIVKVRECNARKGPGTNYEKVGTLAREVILKKIGRKGDWIKVSHPQLTGWVYSKLVWP